MNCRKYELSHSQKRVLITQLLYDESPLFNIGGYVIFNGKVNFERLCFALSEAVKKIDSFSIRLVRESGNVVQYFSHENPNIERITLNKGSNFDDEIRERTRNLISSSFHLFDNTLYKIIALEGGSDNAGYMINFHHIISDGWSISVFSETVSKIYNNQDVEVGSYKDYLEYEKNYLASKRGLIDQEYWSQFINNKVTKKQVNIGIRNSNGFREEFDIQNNIRDKFIYLEQEGYNYNAVLCAAFLLMDYIQNKKALIGMSSFNRKGKQFRQTCGMFANTLLIGELFTPEMKLVDVLNATKKEIYASLYHYQWPYDLLGIKNDEQVFSYNVNYYNTDLTFPLGDVHGNYYEIYSGAQDIPFQLVLSTWGGQWKICVDMREDMYHHGDGIAVIHFLEEALNSFIEKKNQTIDQFIKERKKKIFRMQNSAFMEELENRHTFSERIARVFNCFDEELDCIIYENGNISYKEFAEMIYGAIDIYKSNNICSGEKIVIYLPNGLEYVVYTFAAVICGICFIPMDISMPVSQVEYIYINSKANAIVTMKEVVKGLLNIIFPLLNVGKKRSLEEISEDQPAYILYTSGSTGIPKGVVVERKAIASYLDWAEVCYGKGDYFLYSSPSFDLSLTTLFLPLTSGGKLIICRNEAAALYSLPDHNAVEKVNAIKATPSNLSLLLQQNTSKLHLKTIICGGEELTVNLAYKLQECFGRNCKIYNEYGPTECTVGCMCYLYNMNYDLGNAVSIGKAAPGCQVYVVDSNQELCDVGKTGEIYLSGRQLAQEYWNLPEENSQVFLHDLFGQSRLYKTGDMGRYCSDGNVEYLGRIGRQVKVNGYRIELDSIERILKSLPYVNNAIVWVTHKEQDSLLAAVETSKYTRSQLVKVLETKLPPYCIPYNIYIYDTLPMTRNGKIDVKYLEQSPKVQSGLQDKPIIVEQVIREVLDYSGKMDKFNYLLAGGDSVRALRIITTLEEKGYKLSLADLLDHSSFEELLLYIQPICSAYENKHDYELPKHLKYLSVTCEDFKKYRHLLIVRYNRPINKEEATNLNSSLREVFPSLNIVYRDNHIYENMGGQMLNWSFVNDEDEIHKQLKEVYNNNSSELGFIFYVFTSCDLSWLCYNVHHLLVDGIAWRELLHRTNDILCGLSVRKYRNMEIWKMDDIISFIQPEHLNNDYEEYCFKKQRTKIDRNISSLEFAEAVRKSIVMNKQWESCSLMLDYNGRDLIDLEQSNNIGCYSVMLPIDITDTVDSHIQRVRSQKMIDIKQSIGFRINYLGNLNDMLPANMELLDESLEFSLESCSAYGCLAEVTGVKKEDEIVIYFSWRDKGVKAEDAITFLSHVSEHIQCVKNVGLIELSQEEEDSLFC